MKKRCGNVMLAVLFLSVLTVVIMVTPLVKAQSMSLSPSSGAAGSSVTVTVSGFAANEAVGITFNGATLTNGFEFTTSSTGSGSETYTVPSLSAGNYTISAAGQSGDSASATFTITASTSATPTPTPAPTATAAPSASASPTSTPKIPEFSNAAFALIVAAIAATTLCAAAYAKKRRPV